MLYSLICRHLWIGLRNSSFNYIRNWCKSVIVNSQNATLFFRPPIPELPWPTWTHGPASGTYATHPAVKDSPLGCDQFASLAVDSSPEGSGQFSPLAGKSSTENVPFGTCFVEPSASVSEGQFVNLAEDSVVLRECSRPASQASTHCLELTLPVVDFNFAELLPYEGKVIFLSKTSS